jgi:hypothetical protein
VQSVGEGEAMVGAPVSTWWYGLMALGGLAFGLIGDRRPFGNDVLAHPLVVFFAVAAAGLLIVRVATARPVPELLSERTLVIGCLVGAAAFLTGNWAAAHILPR